jgi:hypothetical protein
VNVPDWFDKLQAVVWSPETDGEPAVEQEVTREEWMILSDLNTPFENSEQLPELKHNWHDQQINMINIFGSTNLWNANMDKNKERGIHCWRAVWRL